MDVKINVTYRVDPVVPNDLTAKSHKTLNLNAIYGQTIQKKIISF